MAKYIYPAIFDPNENGGYTITFPDLPGCVTEGDDMEDAMHMAAEAMALHLYGMERDSEMIPDASPPSKVQYPEDAESDAFVTLISARTEPIRDEMMNRTVKKTLTVPYWLNAEAEKEGVNFSQILQQAIKDKLGIHEKRF